MDISSATANGCAPRSELMSKHCGANSDAESTSRSAKRLKLTIDPSGSETRASTVEELELANSESFEYTVKHFEPSLQLMILCHAPTEFIRKLYTTDRHYHALINRHPNTVAKVFSADHIYDMNAVLPLPVCTHWRDEPLSDRRCSYIKCLKLMGAILMCYAHHEDKTVTDRWDLVVRNPLAYAHLLLEVEARIAFEYGNYLALKIGPWLLDMVISLHGFHSYKHVEYNVQHGAWLHEECRKHIVEQLDLASKSVVKDLPTYYDDEKGELYADIFELRADLKKDALNLYESVFAFQNIVQEIQFLEEKKASETMTLDIT